MNAQCSRCRVGEEAHLIPIHRHPLALPAQLAIRARTNRPRSLPMHLRTTLLERQQLLRAEALVVDLRRCLDEVLEVGAREEVAEVDELAVPLVFHVDGAPAVLAPAHGLAGDVDVALGADDGEGDDALQNPKLARSLTADE